MNILGRFKSDTETMELQQVKWVEETEETRHIVTETLVWSGGAEERITYVDEGPHHQHYYQDRDGAVVLSVDERPAYTKNREVEEETVTARNLKYAWVKGNIPEGCEPTGRTKEVQEVLEG